MKWVKWVFALLIVGWGVLIFPFYGFSFCNQREKQASIPENLQGKIFYFSSDLIYLQGGGPSFEAGCTSTQQNTMRSVETKKTIDANIGAINGYEHSIIPIPSNTSFTIEKAFLVKPFGFSRAFNSEILYYLIKDQNGMVAMTPQFQFECITGIDECRY